MALWHERTTYAHEINAYVNSRRARPTPVSIVSSEEAADPDNDLIHPEWKALLDQYYRELDSLREDWALEVLGRYTQIRTNFGHRENVEGLRMSVQSKPWYIPCFLVVEIGRKTHFLSRCWKFRIEEKILPLWWRPLKCRYSIRLDKIDQKYCKLLGIETTGWGFNEKIQ